MKKEDYINFIKKMIKYTEEETEIDEYSKGLKQGQLIILKNVLEDLQNLK